MVLKEKPQNQDSTSVCHLSFTKKVNGYHGQYARSGISVRKNNGKSKVRKRHMSLKNNSPDSKAYFGKKLILGVWRLILGRYDVISDIYHIILKT